MECETALSNETKTKESFPALYHAVLEHWGPTARYGTVSCVHAFTHRLLTLISTAPIEIYYFNMALLITCIYARYVYFCQGGNMTASVYPFGCDQITQRNKFNGNVDIGPKKEGNLIFKAKSFEQPTILFNFV